MLTRVPLCRHCPRSMCSLRGGFPWTSRQLTKRTYYHCIAVSRSANTARCISIMTQYQRLAVCIRRGSSTVESTMFPPQASSAGGGAAPAGVTSPGGSTSTRKADELTSVFAMKSLPPGGVARSPRSAAGAALSGSAASGGEGASTVASLEQCTESALQLMSSPPSSDHALAYTVLDSGVRLACQQDVYAG
jgi:hypothetical protein